MKRLTSLIAFLVAITYGYSEYSEIIDYTKSYKAQVIAVSDGDTITVLAAGNKEFKIRFHIDKLKD